MVCSFCSSSDGLLQKCSRKLNFHLIQESICGAAQAPSISETLFNCLDKKVKLIQIRNINFFPASSATLETFSTSCLHQHYGYRQSPAAHCPRYKQPIKAQAGTLSPAAVQERRGKAGSNRDSKSITWNLILRLYLTQFFLPWSNIFFWTVVFNSFIYHYLMAYQGYYYSNLRDLIVKYKIIE